MRLTKHFVDNWKLRVSNGVEPVVEAVMDRSLGFGSTPSD